ncbi:MAG: phosphoribosylformylglycinamidine synthase subunit PurL [Actinobacteria bacterium]|nr:MAG: phosphoribosylformylglycinamidine synthase subunit PurL [Actinomycetota bacterium]
MSDLLSIALELGLKEDEYSRIVKILGRQPTKTEIAMYSVMWSEHCAYKHSRKLLSKLPKSSPYVLQGPGENAGIINIGEDKAIALKMESHNHPSAVEPFQGAATGVGGIVRDIFTMGARPIASMNSLRFGNLSNPRQRYLIDGVVDGIAQYGNCIGVPTVGGEIYFEDAYAENCLVNAMCVGLLEGEKIIMSGAAGPGNLVILMGSKTGRDGIGGCSVLASEEFDETSANKRPSVQVGNPFMEKLLIEAVLELKGKDLLVALQDFGAAGITCSSCEMSSKGEAGMELDLDKVPQREPNMAAYEMMMSESQERMMAVVTPEKLEQFMEVCDKWEVPASVVGKVTDDGMVTIRHKGRLEAQLPSKSLTDDIPIYCPEAKEPPYIKEVQSFDPLSLKEPDDLNEALLSILGSPDVASKKWVYSQYDHMVQTNTLLLPGSDAAVVGIKGTNKAIAITTDCNGRHCYLDPYEGTKEAVAEAARNIVCCGGKPLAVTDCLNFGNPEKPHIFWQFSQSIEGMIEACKALDTPVVSGNVSFYNESFGEAIYPTPTIGMVGIIEDIKHITSIAFKEGDAIILLGETKAELGGSQYLKVIHNKISGKPPAVDLEKEKSLQEAVLAAIKQGLVSSAHDSSDGGLAIALAKCCIAGGVGAWISLEYNNLSFAQALFSESNSRVIISCKADNAQKIQALCENNKITCQNIGQATGQSLSINNTINLPLGKLRDVYEKSLEKQIVGGKS